jgi:diacylglycerol kinase (ATP)
MSKLRKILFIINPLSGTGKKDVVPQLIKKHLSDFFETKVVYTKEPKHATELSIQAAKEEYYLVFAVGGDGSVNEVVQGLINTQTRLGIIPVGSGNGLARHLNIPLDIEKAIKLLLSETYVSHDVGSINKHYFVTTAGIGFDAKIAEKFWKLKKRGFINYVKTIIQEFSQYKSPTFKITEGEEGYATEAFILTIANASQYGNQAIIAPGANAGDGYLELCRIDSFSAWQSPFVALRLMTGTIAGAKYYHRKMVTKLTITGDFSWFHADGEPFECSGKVNINIIPGGLKILAPKFI